MIKYKLRQDTINNSEAGEYTAYGMDAIDAKSNETIESFPDLAFNRATMENLINECNELKVDTAHIYDIIEDFLP